MSQILMIVARDEPGLRWYLAHDFEGVEVVLDRRRGERRQGTQAHPEGRRRGDRRHDLNGESNLRCLGFTIARRQEGGPTTVQMH
jgi:hypothetical protein